MTGTRGSRPIGTVDPATRFARSRDALETDAIRGAVPTLRDAIGRRGGGRYARDAFGADPLLQDLLAPCLGRGVRVEVRDGTQVPARGPAVVLVNCGLGMAEPLAVIVAVRQAVERRLRVACHTSLPLAGDVSRRFGSIGERPEDLASALRAGHLVGVRLGRSGLLGAAGGAPVDVLGVLAHFPVLPVAVRPGGPFRLALKPWIVQFGSVIAPPADASAAGAAELAEQARAEVAALLARRD